MQFSDIRLKTNIEDLVDALDIVQKLQGKTYQWKKGRKCMWNILSDRCQSGRERREESDRIDCTRSPKSCPWSCKGRSAYWCVTMWNFTDFSGLLSVAYAELVPVLIEAFKQHMRDYENDKTDVKNELQKISEKLEKIEKGTKCHDLLSWPSANQKSMASSATYRYMRGIFLRNFTYLSESGTFQLPAVYGQPIPAPYHQVLILPHLIFSPLHLIIHLPPTQCNTDPLLKWDILFKYINFEIV